MSDASELRISWRRRKRAKRVQTFVEDPKVKAFATLFVGALSFLGVLIESRILKLLATLTGTLLPAIYLLVTWLLPRFSKSVVDAANEQVWQKKRQARIKREAKERGLNVMDSEAE